MKIKYANDKSIWKLTEPAGVPLLVSPLLEETGIVKQGFSTKLGGVSKGDCATMNISTTRGDDPEAVNENRRRLAAAIGVGVSQASAALASFPEWVTTIFGKSPVVLATLIAVILNIVLPKSSDEKKHEARLRKRVKERIRKDHEEFEQH